MNDKYRHIVDSLFTGDSKGNLKMWTVTPGKMVKDFGPAHEKTITYLHLTVDGNTLFSGDEFGHFKQWCVNDMKLIKDYESSHEQGVRFGAVHPDGENFFTFGSKGDVKQWNTSDQKMIFDYGIIWADWIMQSTFSMDGSM